MGAGDTALTPVSEISLAAASHLFNTPDLRKPSDAAFTATLSSGAHAIGRRALALDNSTGHLGKGERWFPEHLFSLAPLWWLCSYGQLKWWLLCWLCPIGRKIFSLFPVVMCCRLPDCWSIKIIVMEIDLIDNVPCSHCEQLVPCEHNPEMSSKNFPPQTFNPSSLFLSSSPEEGKGKMPEETKSFYVKNQQER